MIDRVFPDIEQAIVNGIHGTEEVIDKVLAMVKKQGVLTVGNHAIFMSGIAVSKHKTEWEAKAAAMEQSIRENCKTILLELCGDVISMKEFNGKEFNKAMKQEPRWCGTIQDTKFLSDDDIKIKVRFP